MGCSFRRLSYASWRLHVFREIFLTANEFQLHTRNLSYTSVRNANDQDRNTQNSEDGINDTNTLRPSRQLPQSSLFTKVETFHEKKRKKLPGKAERFRLNHNPWAMALASPPRACVLTGFRQPKVLMHDWGLVRRPGTRDLWFMPVGLLWNELREAAKVEDPDGTQEQASKIIHNEEPKELNSPPHLRVIRLTNRLLLLKNITSVFAARNRSQRALVSRMLTWQWKSQHSPISPRQAQKIIWREDMPSFVLKSMRKEVIKFLKNASHRDRIARSWRTITVADISVPSLVEGLEKLEEIDNMGCGAVLIMGNNSSLDSGDRSELADGDAQVSDEQSIDLPSSESPSVPFTSIFPDYVTLPQTSSKVPVFDLTVLLSETDREALLQCHPQFREQALFFCPRDKATVSTMLALWNLKSYVMHDREFLAQDPSIDPKFE